MLAARGVTKALCSLLHSGKLERRDKTHSLFVHEARKQRMADVDPDRCVGRTRQTDGRSPFRLARPWPHVRHHRVRGNGPRRRIGSASTASITCSARDVRRRRSTVEGRYEAGPARRHRPCFLARDGPDRNAWHVCASRRARLSAWPARRAADQNMTVAKAMAPP